VVGVGEVADGREATAIEETNVTPETIVKPCTAVRREDLVPVCPHCEAELPEIYARKPKGPFGVGRGFVFFCPQCRKVMGFGTQWYPFPG
jgi:uncharacterized protein with PIN domain